MNIPAAGITSIDLHELAETFADSLCGITFDGVTARLTFCSHRPYAQDEKGTKAHKVPTCRLVLTPEATVALFHHLPGILDLMVKKGLVNRGAPPAGDTKIIN